ncbi:gliding-motility protein MglA [candidate division KSB1 bacterium]|nr:gliding-motility protein MglA [candidate division KSB1 bacterium]
MLLKQPTDEIILKIAYFGPGMSGKTTNLEKLKEIVGIDYTSELTSISTNNHRTLFFDYMQLKIGPVFGLNPVINLYTVAGQDFYHTTQEIVLAGVDGLVFVADSQPDRMMDNVLSFNQLKRCLNNAKLDWMKISTVLQCNKQDLETALEPEAIQDRLGAEKLRYLPAAAIHGIGVIETLREVLLMVISENVK